MRHASAAARPSGEALLARDVLEKHVPAGDALVVAPEEMGLPALFGVAGRMGRFVYTDFALYRGDRATIAPDSHERVRLELGLDALAEAGAPGAAIVFVTKAKRLFEHTLALTARAVPPGTPVIVAGAKRAGIKSSRAAVERLVGAVIATESARHATAFVARAVPEAAAERDAVIARAELRYRVSAWDASIEIVTLPGVFSDGRLDEGTAMLLQSIPPPRDARTVLDWGCGAGAIGTLVRRAVRASAVDFVDVSTQAVASTRRTLQANGFDGDRVWLSDRMSDVTARYDLIVANPPFHTGRALDYGVTRDFLAQAASHLAPGGRIVVVANAFLNYLDVMREHYADASVVANNRHFHIMQARRRRR